MEDNPMSAGTRVHWRNVLIEAATNRKFVILTTVPCSVCGKRTEFTLAAGDVQRWMDGELIQDALPYLTAVEREALVSGVCSGVCSDELWKDEDVTSEISCPFCSSNDIAVNRVTESQTEYECFDCGETWAEEDE